LFRNHSHTPSFSRTQTLETPWLTIVSAESRFKKFMNLDEKIYLEIFGGKKLLEVGNLLRKKFSNSKKIKLAFFL